MAELDPLLRQPLTDESVRLLHHLLQRRRNGNVGLPTVQEVTDALGFIAATTRMCTGELNDRRLVIEDGHGLFATLKWPALASVQGKQVRMSLSQQLRDAGVEATEAQADSWADADTPARDLFSPPEAGNAADAIFPMMQSARLGHIAHALAGARKVTAAAIPTAVVPLLARAAGWFGRVLTAVGDEHSPALKYLPPMSENEAAAEAYHEGYAAELAHNREHATRAYVAALSADPAFLRARLRYVWTLFASDHADAALDELMRLIDAQPALSAARLMRAAILVDLASRDDGDPAGAAAKVAADLDAVDQDTQADRAWSRLLRSRALLMSGQKAVAIKAARHSIALEPSRPAAYHALGLALTAAEDYVAAAWAHGAALLADDEYLVAGEALFNLRQIAQVEAAVPHARALIDHTWQ
jgi:hypothetical protein